MKQLITLFLIAGTLFLKAQNIGISTFSVDPTPTYTTSNTNLVSTFTNNLKCDLMMMSMTTTNFSIYLKYYYVQYTTNFPGSYTDTTNLGNLPAGQYTATVKYYVIHDGSTTGMPNDSVSKTIIFDVLNSVGLKEQHESPVRVFPNPCTDKLQVENGTGDPFDYRFVSMDGKTSPWASSDNDNISLAGLTSGVYLIEIQSGRTTKRIKLVKHD